MIFTDKKLNRKHAPDSRDHNYLIKNLPAMKKLPQITQKFWDDNGWWGDQKDTPYCVGYAWAHWIEDGPVEHAGVAPVVPPLKIYENAQKLDEWPGENYDGTSVRGGVKYLQGDNKIGSYYWAFDAKTVANAILTLGPVVVGTDWYSAMFLPDRRGFISVAGKLAGGHAYVLNGVDTVAGYFRIKNSWGRNWGINGHAYIRINSMDRLIKANGEACIAFENAF